MAALWTRWASSEILVSFWPNQTQQKYTYYAWGIDHHLLKRRVGKWWNRQKRLYIIVFSAYVADLNVVSETSNLLVVSMQLAKISENLTTLQGTTVTYPTKKWEVWKTSSTQKGWIPGWIWWYDTFFQEGSTVTRSLMEKPPAQKTWATTKNPSDTFDENTGCIFWGNS